MPVTHAQPDVLVHCFQQDACPGVGALDGTTHISNALSCGLREGILRFLRFITFWLGKCV